MFLAKFGGECSVRCLSFPITLFRLLRLLSAMTAGERIIIDLGLTRSVRSANRSNISLPDTQTKLKPYQ